MDDIEQIAEHFLELSSEQRLEILTTVVKKPYRISVLAKELGVTSQEIHRNIDRLAQKGFVKKGVDDHYHITTIGQIMLSQVPLIKLIAKNTKFFESHDISHVPQKFVKRLAVLEDTKKIKGVTKSLDKWKSIYQNAREFVYDIITESPPGLVEPLIKRISDDVQYLHVITEDLIEPDGRTKTLEKLGYFKYLEEGKIVRRSVKESQVILIMNEKEAGIIFSTNEGEPDLRNMHYGTSTAFREWCKDYFDYVWEKSKKVKKTHIPPSD